MKSIARMASAWECRKVAQVTFERWVAGSTPSALRISVDTPVSPGGVFLGEAEYEAADGSDCAGAAGTPVAAETDVTVIHEVAVPAQDSVRGDDEPQPAQGGSWQRGEESG
ncbi:MULTISPECIES: hypothetical protein [unclassified Streptomyces]|uniref:hypothetical protein n=1 Tax=unclassified Streptomyces TaxID=2593676 RepID=UPI002DDA20F8|nr:MULTISPECIES: hypothetical protein [unclassified Streptomyces]